MQDEILLTDGVRAVVTNSCPVKENVETWRIIVEFISDIPDTNKLIKEYCVWVEGTYLEDHASLTADIESAKKFALQVAEKRFNESGRQIPIENGISYSNTNGESIVNPQNFLAEMKNG